MSIRKSTVLGFLAAVTAVSAASEAQAQFTRVPGTPYVINREAITYQQLQNCTTLTTNSISGSYIVQLPFSFQYYDRLETQVRVTTNANMAFGTQSPSSTSNQPIGSTSSPNGWIAVFADWMAVETINMGRLCHATLGSAPNRRFVVEWQNAWFRIVNGSQDMKIVLYEGPTRRIDIEYGSSMGMNNWTATMGMEDQAGARPIFFAPSMCTTTCSQADLDSVANTRLTYIQDPGVELVASTIEAPALAFFGAVANVTVVGNSVHGNPIGPFSVSVEASTSPDFTDPMTIGTTDGVNANPFEEFRVNVEVVPPEDLEVTQIYLRGVIDPANTITEAIEDNNTVASPTFTRLIPGAPDLSVERVTVVATEFSAGDSLDVITRIRNVGGDPADNTPVRLVLSANPVISRQDVQVGQFSVSLGAGETVTTTTSVTIPAGTNSGTYYFGALADPDNVLVELNDTNNARATFDPVTVVGASLAITTSRLPNAVLRVPYVALLQAVGTTDDATWFIDPADLPTGLGLVPDTGEIFGRPIRAETRTFTAELTSGGETVSRQLMLNVADPEEPLTIVSRNLPQAVVGQEYSFGLLVTGGESAGTVTWMATGLPDGFSIDDQGVINGTPTAPGSFSVVVSATAGGETATRTLTFEVLDNPNLLIVPTPLSTATYGQSYTAQIQAQGGLPPYTFLVASGVLPDGLSLSTSGEITGEPRQVGQFRFVVEARDAGTGARSARDQNAFIIDVLDDGTFSVSTEALPFGVIDIAYEVAVSATGGRPPYSWTREGRLPDGLIDEEDESTGDYVIRGQPTAPGISNLLLTVRDSEGRVAQRAFALEVFETDPTPAPVATDDGGSGAAAFGLLLLGLVGLAVLRKRA